MIRIVVLCLIGCGGTPVPPPAKSPPIANTAPATPSQPEACRNPPGEADSSAGPELLVIYCKHVHEMCACKDEACAKASEDRYAAAKDAFYDKHPNQSRDLSAGDKKFMDPLIVKMAECYHQKR